jgi:hypothetical protein
MRRVYMLMLTLLLAACGQSGVAVQQPITISTSLPAATSAPAPTQAPAPTGAPAQATPPATSQGDSDTIVAEARAALGAQLAGAPALGLQAKEVTTWSDGSLGCPDPATSYIQVMTPGLLITFSDGARTYAIHTTNDGKPMIWCENGNAKILAAVR